MNILYIRCLLSQRKEKGNWIEGLSFFLVPAKRIISTSNIFSAKRIFVARRT